jgi:hypothetical protein
VQIQALRTLTNFALQPTRATTEPQDRYDCLPDAGCAHTHSLKDDPKLKLLWGGKGHALIHGRAALALPEEMPAFFRNAGPRLEGLAMSSRRTVTATC